MRNLFIFLIVSSFAFFLGGDSAYWIQEESNNIFSCINVRFLSIITLSIVGGIFFEKLRVEIKLKVGK